MSAKVESPFDVDEVVFYIDGDDIKSMESGPYEANWTIPADKIGGTAEAKVKITDEKSNNASASKSVSL